MHETIFYKRVAPKIAEVLRQPDLPEDKQEQAELILIGISDALGGEVHRIPMLKAFRDWRRNRSICREYGQLSARELAEKYRLSTKTIYRIIGENNENTFG